MSKKNILTVETGKAIILTQFMSVCAWVIGSFAILNYFVYSPAMGFTLAGNAFFIIIIRQLFLRKKINYNTCAVLLGGFTIFFIVPLSAYFSGGLFSPVTPWLVIIPVGSILLFGIDRRVYIFTAFSIAFLLALTILAAGNIRLPAFNTGYTYIGIFASFTGLISLMFYLTWLFEKQKNAALHLLHAEKALFIKHATQLPGLVYQFQLFKNGRTTCDFINRSATTMFGINLEKAKKNPQVIFNLFHKDDFQKLLHNLLQSSKTLQKWTYEARMIIPGKEIMHVKGSANPERQPDGSTIWYGYVYDITEEKKAGKALTESQNYVKQITSSINDIFYLYDFTAKKYLFVSPNSAFILGVPDTFFYEGEDFTNRFVHEADRQKLLSALHNIEREKKYDVDFRAVINNELKWLNEKAFAIFDDNGNFVKISGILTDITARKTAEERLIKSQRGFEEAQELAHVGSWEYNFKSAFTEWSKETYRIFEMEEIPGEEIAQAFYKKIHPADVKLIEAGLEDMYLNGGIGTLEFRIISNNGDIKYLLAVAETVVSEKDKTSVGMKGTVQDITKQKLAAMAKSNFLSTMSHEIRTPINGVIGISNLLMGEELTPLQKEYVTTLNFSAQHLSTVVSDILDFSKIESGNFTFEKVSFNLEQVCSNIFKLFETQATEKNISYMFNPQPVEGYSLYGDYIRLSQVLTNLLSNAVKFTHKGSVELSYTPVSENSEKITIQFTVKDTGIGITSAQQKRIFESFLQADDSVTRQYGGTGLGLTISKKLVELQGGEINLESVHGKGSTFTFKLSFDKHSFTKQVINTDNKNETDGESLKGMKILVTEDNKINAMVLTRFLNKWNIESHIAKNGQEAVTMSEKENFDLILMDIQMPVMDGRTATNTIRQSANKKLSKIPIIALTADALIDSQRALLKSGFDGCITKPFSPEVLFKLLKKYYKSQQSPALNYEFDME